MVASCTGVVVLKPKRSTTSIVCLLIHFRSLKGRKPAIAVEVCRHQSYCSDTPKELLVVQGTLIGQLDAFNQAAQHAVAGILQLPALSLLAVSTVQLQHTSWQTGEHSRIYQHVSNGNQERLKQFAAVCQGADEQPTEAASDIMTAFNVMTAFKCMPRQLARPLTPLWGIGQLPTRANFGIRMICPLRYFHIARD
eukprot:GHUV01033911.1.p1 GENE.GHUV01033911.1~~GHUV01033911.1.p1  ORF type:complete len:195 (+),score=14.55 GHUV01033911.1:434-1018(+)